MNNKIPKSIAVLIALVMVLSSFTSTLYSHPAADPADWYITVNGVLDSDRYLLYPYKAESLKLGISKFGELIDSNTNIGLEYAGARDPFAPVAGQTVPPELGKHVWINGWFIDIHYNHSVWGPRNVWAGALFADIADYGGPWLRVDNDYGSCTNEAEEAFNLPGKEIDVNNPGEVIGPLRNGGRKTNGTVLTDPIQVLYNGPRLFVAKITNHIYDWYEPAKKNRPLVDLVITAIFNKVKKEVILIKDVKLVPPAKFEVSPLYIEVDGTEKPVPCGYLVQLSNREQWDLGAIQPGTTSYSSYVHFYVDGEGEEQLTVYGYDWTMLPTLPEGTKYKGVTVNRWGDEPDVGYRGEYDVAQIISNDKKFVGWHAFWPSLSDWSVTAGDDGTWYRALKDADPHTTDGYYEPWRSPLIVGEWDFILSDQERKLGGTLEADVQFRAVSVIGITDLNDGEDESSNGTNKIDKEVLYQLNEVFNPWDLYSAVEKETQRFVTFVHGPLGKGAYIKLDEPLQDSEWDAYCSFAERVILLPDGKLWVRGKDYKLYDNDTNGMFDGITLITPLDPGKTLKILFSKNATKAGLPAGRYEWIVVGRDAKSVDSAGAALVASAFKDKIIDTLRTPEGTAEAGSSGAFIGLAGADMYDSDIGMQMPWVMAKFRTGDTRAAYYYSGTDFRTALRDDWCTEWPIASSNMIGVGGVYANLLAYYANDFMTAFFGLGEFTNYMPWRGRIVPLTCWDISKTQSYSSYDNPLVGYAVISTYKDINGTVIFLIWGHWGRDTYYITKWFHEKGIYQLQYAPRGLTSIIVKITYESTAEGYKPKSFKIVECLGTISETEWKHNSEVKGGIHDP